MRRAWRAAGAALGALAVVGWVGAASSPATGKEGLSAQAATCDVDLASTGDASGPGWAVTTLANTSSPNKVLTFNADASGQAYRLCQTSPTAAVRNIAVADGVVFDLVFDQINLATAAQGVPLLALGDQADVWLHLSGDNALQHQGQAGKANNAAIHVPAGARLTILGEGSLTAQGGPGGAGLGGGYNAGTGGQAVGANGAITIAEQARVTARGGEACAGIGSCNDALDSTGPITIGGQAQVDAISGQGGAGIGGGENSYGGQIDIVGAVVVDSGLAADNADKSGAGIGGGATRGGGVISIRCDPADPTACPKVSARGGLFTAAIGGAKGVGESGASEGPFNNTRVAISGGQVEATTGQGGTGIGAGFHQKMGSATVVIEGGQVTAVGGDTSEDLTVAGPGVGGGFAASDMGLVQITGGVVTATGGADYTAKGFMCGAGVGGAGALVAMSTADGKPPRVEIGPGATVRAYSACAERPAIHSSGGNQAATPQYFVNAQFTASAFSNPAGIDLDVYAMGAAPVWETLKLPAGYRGFAYTTGSTESQRDGVTAYATADRTWLGGVVPTDSTLLASGISSKALAVELLDYQTERVTLSNVVTGVWADNSVGELAFTITVLDGQGVPQPNYILYTGSALPGTGATPPGDNVIIFNAQGTGSVKLRHGQAISMELGRGYQVQVRQAAAPAAFATSYRVNGSAPQASLDTGLQLLDGPKAIAFANWRKSGVLTISNAVAGLMADPALAASYQVCVFAPSGAAALSELAYAVDGVPAGQTLPLDSASHCSPAGALALGDGQAAAMALPGEVDFEVIQAPAPAGYQASYQVNGGSQVTGAPGGATSTGRLAVADSDQRIAFTTTRESVAVAISKVVAGAYADRSQSYRFDFCPQDESGLPFAAGTAFPYQGGTVAGLAGVTPPPDGELILDQATGCAALWLSHGQRVALSLPKGAYLDLDEAAVADYEPSHTVNGGQSQPDGSFRGQADGPLAIAFTNSLQTPPPVPSGLAENRPGPALYGLGLAGLALAGGLAWRRGRRLGVAR